MITPLTALDDLRLLFDSLRLRATKPGRPPSDSHGEAAKFVEVLYRALLKCELLPDRRPNPHPPADWHAAPRLKACKLGSGAFATTSTIYGYRTDGWHENPVQFRSSENIRACLCLFEEEILNVVIKLDSRGEDLVNAIFDEQESDVPQVLGRKLVVALLDLPGVELDYLAEQVISKALLNPERTATIRAHPDPMRRMRSTVRHVAAQGSPARTLVALAKSLSESLGDPAASHLASWFEAAHTRLGFKPDATPPQHKAVRVEMEVDPSGQILIQGVSLRPVEQRLPDDLKTKLDLPRIVDAAHITNVIGDVVDGFLRAMAVSRRRLHLVLQLAVPPELTYLDLDRTLTRNFRCVAVAPRVSGRFARALDSPIARPGRVIGNSLEVDDSLTADELLDLLRYHGEGGVDVDCVFAAPALVRPTLPTSELCPAVEAFTEHVVAVHFHPPGVTAQVLALFGENAELALEDLMDRVRITSRECRVTLLWDDSRYHLPSLETLL